MNIRQRILKLFSPEAEQARMNMREARCRAEAVAEDLTRTIITHSADIQKAIKTGKPKVNGNGAHK